MDCTDIIISIIGLAAVLLSTGIAYASKKWLQPWLEQKELKEAAEIVVWAVEAVMGRYCGEEKWAEALDKMRFRGWAVDSKRVIDALKAAWKKLDLSMLMSGEKQPKSGEE